MNLRIGQLATAFSGTLLLLAGCGSSSESTSTAAAVSGPADTHCTVNGTAVKKAVGMCVTDSRSALSADDGGADGAPSSDGAATDDGGGGGGSDFGPTLYNAEGDDDDCKYHVSWTSTAVKQGSGTTFQVKVVRLADGKAATGADVQIEAFLNDTHPTPSTNIPNHESGGGSYSVGPVVFDQPGMWTVRFHFYEMCSDAPEDSPHGHAAFFVNVP